MNSSGLELIRCDQGSGGWSLHVAGTNPEEVPPLVTGRSSRNEQGDWTRPNKHDWETAIAALKGWRKRS